MLNSSQTRPPARPPAADGAVGARGGARSPPRPPRSLPPFPVRRLLPAGGPGGPRALTGLAGSGSRSGARGLSTTARPPRPARRHLGSQARPRAASSRRKGVARADGGPANGKRRRPPASRPIPAASAAADRGRRPACRRALGAGQSER